jgi:hypothetical protein
VRREGAYHAVNSQLAASPRPVWAPDRWTWHHGARARWGGPIEDGEACSATGTGRLRLHWVTGKRERHIEEEGQHQLAHDDESSPKPCRKTIAAESAGFDGGARAGRVRSSPG